MNREEWLNLALEVVSYYVKPDAPKPVRKGRQCDLCRKHYKDTLGCDEGKPVASPHKTPGKEREVLTEVVIRARQALEAK